MLQLVDKKAHVAALVYGQRAYILERMHAMSSSDFDDAVRQLHNYEIKLYVINKEEAARACREAEDIMPQLYTLSPR